MVGILNPTDKGIQLKKGIHCHLEEVMVMETTPPAANQTGFAKITEKSGDKGQSETETVLAPLWPGVAEDVPDEVKDQLLAMLIDHKAAFCLKNWDLGFTDTLRYEMKTGNKASFRQLLRRNSQSSTIT